MQAVDGDLAQLAGTFKVLLPREYGIPADDDKRAKRAYLTMTEKWPSRVFWAFKYLPRSELQEKHDRRDFISNPLPAIQNVKLPGLPHFQGLVGVLSPTQTHENNEDMEIEVADASEEEVIPTLIKSLDKELGELIHNFLLFD